MRYGVEKKLQIKKTYKALGKYFQTPKHVPKLQGSLSILYNTILFAIQPLYLQKENKDGQEYGIHVHHIPNTIQQTVENIKCIYWLILNLRSLNASLKPAWEDIFTGTKCKIV